jgi:UDP-glucose 6-dehydrogenase
MSVWLPGQASRTWGTMWSARVALWGLAFKPSTDDLREAPALIVIEDLLAAGAEVVATDPVAIPAAQTLLGQRVRFAPSNYACAEGADALALITEWRDYRRPNFQRLAGLMRVRRPQHLGARRRSRRWPRVPWDRESTESVVGSTSSPCALFPALAWPR